MPIPSVSVTLLAPNIPVVYPPGAASQNLTFASGYTPTSATFAANVDSSPAYIQSAGLLIESTATADHQFGGSATLSAGARTLTFYVKRASGVRDVRCILFNAAFASYPHIVISPLPLVSNSNTFIIGSDFTGLAVTTKTMPNNWVRVVATFTIVTGTSFFPTFYLWNSVGGVTNYAGDGSSGLLLWGLDIR